MGDFHERYTELNDYSQLTHYLHISAPVAIAYVSKDRTPEGNLQFIFHLDNGCYLRTKVKDVIDCDEDLYHGIIWATRVGAVWVILTRKVEDGFERIGLIDRLGSGNSDELLTSDHVCICKGHRIPHYFEDEFWMHLKTEHMTLRLI